MKYEIDLPADIERRLSERATAMGQEVRFLIRAAVVRFVDEDAPVPLNGGWSDELQARRSDLIDKDIAGTISAAEREELASLDRLANAHFDRVAPPPLDGPRRLHEQLLKRRADNA